MDCSAHQLLCWGATAVSCWNVDCRIWSPKYWTSRSIASFNFTGFLDYESGPPYYQWGIGTREGLVDVVPLINVTATRVLKDVRYEGGVQKMMVTPVVSMGSRVCTSNCTPATCTGLG